MYKLSALWFISDPLFLSPWDLWPAWCLYLCMNRNEIQAHAVIWFSFVQQYCYQYFLSISGLAGILVKSWLAELETICPGTCAELPVLTSCRAKARLGTDRLFCTWERGSSMWNNQSQTSNPPASFFIVLRYRCVPPHLRIILATIYLDFHVDFRISLSTYLKKRGVWDFHCLYHFHLKNYTCKSPCFYVFIFTLFL